jgi:Protein of unknown function (DUF1214)
MSQFHRFHDAVHGHRGTKTRAQAQKRAFCRACNCPRPAWRASFTTLTWRLKAVGPVTTTSPDNIGEGFWSLTMYDPQHFFYANSLKRYALGTKNKSLKYNGDGSLTIYLGNKSPGPEKESNWLPAPPGNLSIWLRTYWPD